MSPRPPQPGPTCNHPLHQDVDSFAVVFAINHPTVGTWPAVLVEVSARLYDVTGLMNDSAPITRAGVVDALGRNLVTQALCKIGMVQVDGVLGQIPPQVEGWRVRLPSGDHPGGIYFPPGSGPREEQELHEPMPPVAEGWPDLAAQAGGRCGVYLNDGPSLKNLHGLRFLGGLQYAGQAGHLIGVGAQVVFP